MINGIGLYELNVLESKAADVKQKRTQYPYELKLRFLDKVRSGVPVNKAASELGIGKRLAHRWNKKGVSDKAKRVSEYTVEETKKMLAANESARSISKKLKISRETVRRIKNANY